MQTKYGCFREAVYRKKWNKLFQMFIIIIIIIIIIINFSSNSSKVLIT